MNRETHICDQCGYELTGLAYRGRCPECGQVFNQIEDQGVKRIDTPGKRATRWVDRHLRTLVLAVVGLMIMGCAGLGTIVGGLTASRSAALLGLLAATCLLVLIASYVDE